MDFLETIVVYDIKIGKKDQSLQRQSVISAFFLLRYNRTNMHCTLKIYS